jgi:drug/metabolite transporter (DMT)-like permease
MAATRPLSRSLALLHVVGGVAFLCMMDAAVKYLALRHGVLVTTFARYAAGLLVATVVWAMAGRPSLPKGGWPLNLLRGGLIAVMALAFFWSITQLPLALVLTITFVAPLLMPPMAALFLKEPMQARFVGAGLIGFVGVLVAAGGMPDLAGTRLLAVLAALFAAVCYAGSAIVLRARAAADGAVLVTLVSALVPAAILSPIAFLAPLPALPEWGGLLVLGILGNIGVQLLARGYAALEAQASAVLEFTGLPWAALFGWLLFGEALAPTTLAGAAIIMLAVAWSARPARNVQTS